MIRKSLYSVLLFLLVLTLSQSCNRDPFRADISGIDPDIRITRFEPLLFSVDPSALEEFIPQWEKEYGRFFSHFCYVTGLGDPGDPLFPERLKAFITDRNNYRLYTRTMQIFPDIEAVASELDKAFSHYLYHFPERPVPRIYTFISAFSQSAITDDSLLAIGLDRYLGADEPFYRQAGIYDYLTVNMHPRKIVSDCMSFWGETEFVFNDSVNNLITNLVYRGRLMYFTRAMVPGQPDSLIWGFNESDLDYLASNEKAIWAYLIEHKLLFKTDRFTINKFILEGPFTSDFGRESPARSAVWIGYRITGAYMKRNPDIRLKELMEEKDYLKILNLSGYNP